MDYDKYYQHHASYMKIGFHQQNNIDVYYSENIIDLGLFSFSSFIFFTSLNKILNMTSACISECTAIFLLYFLFYFFIIILA